MPPRAVPPRTCDGGQWYYNAPADKKACRWRSHGQTPLRVEQCHVVVQRASRNGGRGHQARPKGVSDAPCRSGCLHGAPRSGSAERRGLQGGTPCEGASVSERVMFLLGVP